MRDSIYDLVIVGAGIIGANVAYLCSQQHPHWRVALVEKNIAGQGASAYSAGVDILVSQSLWHKKLSIQSRKLYQQYQRELPHLPRFSFPSYWIVSDSKLKDFYQKIKGEKLIPVLHPKADPHLQRLGIKLKPHDCVFTQAGNSYGHVSNIIHILLNVVTQQKNFHYLPGTDVKQLTKLPYNLLQLKTTDGRRLLTRRVINAVGPWSTLLPTQVIEKTRVKKVAAFHIHQKPTSNDSFIGFFDSGNFLLPCVNEGFWLFSFTSQQWNCEPQKETLTLFNSEWNYARHFLKDYVPAFGDYFWSSRVFCDRYTDQRIPIIKHDPDHPQHTIITGCSGSGYRLAPALALHALKNNV